MTIEKRNLGNTGIKISPIGLGTWQFSQKKGWAGTYWSFVDQETIREIVQVSLRAGINWFDTAEIYGNGQSEKVLSEALKDNQVKYGEVVIATKWWPVMRTSSNIIRTIDQRQHFLDGFSIDLYQVHQPFGLSSLEKEMEAMAALAEAGKIKAVGISNYNTDQMKRAHEYLSKKGLVLASNQVRYNLLNRRIEKKGMIEAAKELGITIIAYSPLEQGILTGKFHKDPGSIKSRRPRSMMPNFREKGLERSRPLIELLEKMAEKYQATPAEVALSWLINYHGDTVVAIPGSTKTEHAEANARSLSLQLSRDDMEQLHETSLSLS